MLRTRIKFCGFTEVDDVVAAIALGADAIGFVLYEHSPRAITLTQLAKLSAIVPPFVARVGLFVNAKADCIAEAAVFLDVLQFHGQESPEACQNFGLPWIKAIPMSPTTDLAATEQRYQKASALLLDAPATKDLPGGNGKTLDWSLINTAYFKKPWILAGGLTAENVTQGIEILKPYAVDVSSGIESTLGRKSTCRMQAFMQAVVLADKLKSKIRCS